MLELIQEVQVENFTSSVEFYLILGFLAFGKIILGMLWTVVMKTGPFKEHRVYKVAIPSKQRRREILNSWHVVSDAIVLYAITTLNWINFSETSLSTTSISTTVITFLALFIWVETWYYHIHRLMHKYNWFYKFHKQHHLSMVLTPLSSIAMSSVEKWIFYSFAWFGFLAIASWFIPINVYGIVVYFVLHFAISLHGHSNTEAASATLFFSKIGLASSASHAIHHARFNKNYGFITMFWDKTCGSYAEDTMEMQRNAIEKQGAPSLKTKLSP